jgi:hypothetical protein
MIGSLLPSKDGCEAFDVARRSLGIFPTEKDAADAISMVAS